MLDTDAVDLIERHRTVALASLLAAVELGDRVAAHAAKVLLSERVDATEGDWSEVWPRAR